VGAVVGSDLSRQELPLLGCVVAAATAVAIVAVLRSRDPCNEEAAGVARPLFLLIDPCRFGRGCDRPKREP
jgi:hypothetical protein